MNINSNTINDAKRITDCVTSETILASQINQTQDSTNSHFLVSRIPKHIIYLLEKIRLSSRVNKKNCFETLAEMHNSLRNIALISPASLVINNMCCYCSTALRVGFFDTVRDTCAKYNTTEEKIESEIRFLFDINREDIFKKSDFVRFENTIDHILKANLNNEQIITDRWSNFITDLYKNLVNKMDSLCIEVRSLSLPLYLRGLGQIIINGQDENNHMKLSEIFNNINIQNNDFHYSDKSKKSNEITATGKPVEKVFEKICGIYSYNSSFLNAICFNTECQNIRTQLPHDDHDIKCLEECATYIAPHDPSAWLSEINAIKADSSKMRKIHIEDIESLLIKINENSITTNSNNQKRSIDLKGSFGIYSNKVIHDGDTIMTVGYSEVVLEFLKDALLVFGRSFNVIVVQREPFMDGRKMAKELTEINNYLETENFKSPFIDDLTLKPINITLVSDTASSVLISSVTTVIIEPYVVLTTGGLITPSGCSLIAEEATANSVNVIALCGNHQICPNAWEPETSIMLSSKLIMPDADIEELNGVQFMVPLRDSILPECVSYIITNKYGLKRPSEIFKLIPEIYSTIEVENYNSNK